MIIDWSKAPEGFDYFLRDKRIPYQCRFYRKDDDLRRYVSLHDSYVLFEDAENFKIETRPIPAWTGEGAPPVGAMVTIDRMGLHIWPDAEIFIGPSVKVLANYMAGDEPMIVVEDPDGYANCCFRACMARKPLTPEQIAAEERTHGIAEMCKVLKCVRGSFGEEFAMELYDAGYRKEVKP